MVLLADVRERVETAQRRSRRRRREREQESRHVRADIQGLRAVAVIAVVINHLTNHPVGGFVGVDVFFVISGYLITGRLLRGLGTGGPVTYMWDFYKLRIRRILPAALVVIALTILASQLVFTGTRAHQTMVDGGWAAAFWANWHFIDLSTNYFTATAPPSPFQHYWSLAVEEQFYFVWPIILLATGWLVSALVRRDERRDGVRRMAGAVAVLMLSGVTLWWGWKQSSSDPTTAYFSTFTRGWELGLGALLACVVPSIRRVPQIALTVASFAGLVLIGISLFTITGGTHFPVPGALLPCVGSALVIGAVSREHRARNIVLTNRLSVLIGNISYSIYLVHFPVIVLLASYLPRGGYLYASAVLLSLGLSAALYAFVERPVLDSRFLRPKGRGDSAVAAKDPITMRGWSLTAIAGLALALAVVAVWPGRAAQEAAKYQQINDSLTPPAAGSTTKAQPEQAALTQQITEALSASRYPKLSPSLDAEEGRWIVPPRQKPCSDPTLGPASQCTFGDPHASHTAYLVGDSIATSYSEAFVKIVEQTPGWKLRVASGVGCMFISVPLVNPTAKALQSACPPRTQSVVDEINRAHPDLVIVSNTYGFRRVLATGQQLTDALFAQHVGDEVQLIAKSAKQVVVVAPPPEGLSISDCYRPSGAPVSCASRITDDWSSREGAMRRYAAAHGWPYLDSRPWFCNASGYCPVFVGHTPSKHDAEHPAYAYDYVLFPVIREAMTAQKVMLPAAK